MTQLLKTFCCTTINTISYDWVIKLPPPPPPFFMKERSLCHFKETNSWDLLVFHFFHETDTRMNFMSKPRGGSALAQFLLVWRLAEARGRQSWATAGKGRTAGGEPPRATGMYSKHRQKNAQISPAKNGRLLFLLCFFLLNGQLEITNGEPGEQGKEKKERTYCWKTSSDGCIFL